MGRASPDGKKVLAKADRGGRYFVAVDGKVRGAGFEKLWDPVFSPDGTKVMLRYVEENKYYRQVIPTDEL